ncbi:MAG: hypothetical protein ABGX27_01975 [Desulfurobacteriaceae bacterium]
MTRLLIVSLISTLLLSCGTDVKEEAISVPAPSQPSSFTSSPLPPKQLTGIEKLNEYQKHLVFAERYLEEGDFFEALKEIEVAKKFKTKEDPVFYELRGKIYDGIGDKEKAFEDLKKAAWLFYKEENFDKAWELLGWLRSLRPDSPEVEKLEKSLREEEI